MTTGRIELSRSALEHNVRALKSLIRPGVEVAAVVKGNAYGHGMAEIVPLLEPHVDAFQVDDLDELRTLRALTKKRALVFGYVPLESVPEALELGGELCVYDTHRLPEIAKARNPVVHLKIDALLGRQGLLPNEIDTFLEDLAKYPNIQLKTAYAHYANIEDTVDPSHALAQEGVFLEALQKARARFPKVGRHLSATSGLMAREGEAGPNNMIRLGIGLYGLYPSEPLALSLSTLELQSVMRWTSMLAQVKTLPPFHPVGYGLTYITERPTKVGIVPQGYADGYDRGLSNCGEVLVHGIRCEVLGRIAMNMFAVDLSRVENAAPEDEVVLLGSQEEEKITAEEIAAKIGTINYEVVARISPLLKRQVG